jgi:HK97 family phage major capsid protein
MSATAGKEKPAVEETAPTKPAESNQRKKEHLFRFSTVDTESADDEAKTIQVCFSSEELVLRKATEYDEKLGVATKGTKYWEMMSHRAEDVDLSELDGGKGTVLDEHENSLQLGKVPRAKLSKDAVCRAVLKFDGLSELSTTRYNQMKRGERTGISTGYWHTRFVCDEGEKDGHPIKRLAWAADEVSSVRNAADKVRAGVRRSAEGQWSCLCCGNLFDRAKLDENYECGCDAEIRSKREALKTRKATKPDDFKFKRDKEDELSFSQVSQMVSKASDSDKRFKSKRPNGDVISASYVQDICLDTDTGEWSAIIYNWMDATYWRVAFTVEGAEAVLGEGEEVKWVGVYEPVTARSVDSTEKKRAERSAADNLQKKVMPKTIAELQTEAPEAVAALRKDMEKEVRSIVMGEVDTRSKKRDPLKKEIRALRDSFIKDHGQNWAGKSGEVVVVGERIRAFAEEALEADDTHSDSEVRSDFKNKCNELIRASRAPKNQEEAANLDESLASRCSLKNIYRAAANAQMAGRTSTAFIPNEGAEFEAHQELRRKANEFPGGMGVDSTGVMLPANMPCRSIRANRNQMSRLTRDALAGDFSSAGALIQPDYRFPTIELLRNKSALGRAGITFLGGVLGNLVLPRQTSATTTQSVAEGAILTAYDQAFDQIRLSPHRVGSFQKYSRLALLQPSEDFEAIVMNDHALQMALKIDYLLLNGSGAGDEPLGLMNQVGIGSVVFAGSAANAYKNLIALETLIRKSNIDEAPTYITTSTARGTLRITPATLTGSTVVSGTSNALWVGEEVVGRPAVDSQQVPGDAVVCLVGSQVVCAQWGGIAVVLDTQTLAEYDKIKLAMNTYIDGALRHPSAVARSADSAASLT